MISYIDMLTEGELIDHLAKVEHHIERLKIMKAHYENALMHRQTKKPDEFDMPENHAHRKVLNV